MLTSTIINELNKKIPYLIQSYGGLDLFLIYMKEQFDINTALGRRSIPRHKYQRVLNTVYSILEFADDVHLISPWSMNVELYSLDEVGRILPDSVDLDKPYKIYNLDHYLLYTVKEHDGFFGNSRLDRDLVNSYPNTAGFYLKYITYKGEEKIKLLMVNTHTEEVAIKNERFAVSSQLKTSTVTIANFSNNDVDLVTLVDVPSSPPNLVNILDFGTQETIQPGTSSSVIPTSGTWVYLNTSDIVTRPTITNVSNDIIIPVIQNSPVYLYYVGFNTNPALLNKLYGRNLAYTDKRIQDIIEIN